METNTPDTPRPPIFSLTGSSGGQRFTIAQNFFSESTMRNLISIRHFPRVSRVFLLGLLACLLQIAPASAVENGKNTYDQASILNEAKAFFGEASEGLAKAIEKAFREQGRPVGYIKGEELSAAITVGVSYGKGNLMLKNGETAKVFWQGPSLGFDLGFNASKVFTLVYNLPSKDAIYQRFPGVDGSLYVVAGIGMNYQRRQDIVLAPIRLGAGWRTGASVGYLHYTRERAYNPL